MSTMRLMKSLLSLALGRSAAADSVPVVYGLVFIDHTPVGVLDTGINERKRAVFDVEVEHVIEQVGVVDTVVGREGADQAKE